MAPKKNGRATSRNDILQAVNNLGGKIDGVQLATGALDTRLARIEERVTGMKEGLAQHQKDIERLENRDTNVGILAVITAAVGSTIAAVLGTRN